MNEAEEIKYQAAIIMQDIANHVRTVEDIKDIDCDDLIEKLKGIKEIQASLATLTN